MARVLLIDDDPAMRLLVSRILRAHDLHYAPSSAEGLAALEIENFAAVICDLTMPKMNGIELHRAAATAPSTQGNRFIFVTGATDVPEFIDYTNKHQLGWLAKPFSPNALRGLVNALVEDSGAPQ